MTMTVNYDKVTGVAFVDVCANETAARVRIIDVSSELDLSCEVLARIDEQSGQLLGLIIEDYSAFKREVMKKYVAFAAERMMELIVSRVREALGTLSGQRELSLC